MIGISLYHLRKSLKELEEKDFIKIIRKGQGKADTIYLTDFQSTSENPSHLLTIIEEEKKIEEEEEEFTPNINNITPKNDEPTPGSHQIGTPDDISTENVEIITCKNDEPTPDQDLDPEIPEQRTETVHQPSQEPPRGIFFTEASKRLTNDFRQVVRDESYRFFIKDKISVCYEDDENITINCLNYFIYYHLSKNYSGIAREITGKKVKFITLNGGYDGEEDTGCERDEEILKGITRRNK